MVYGFLRGLFRGFGTIAISPRRAAGHTGRQAVISTLLVLSLEDTTILNQNHLSEAAGILPVTPTPCRYPEATDPAGHVFPEMVPEAGPHGAPNPDRACVEALDRVEMMMQSIDSYLPDVLSLPPDRVRGHGFHLCSVLLTLWGVSCVVLRALSFGVTQCRSRSKSNI